MGIERDTFLGFIDDLAADLDDHESSADERAARHFLSRSHFDRLISATAGEPPAAFRRRILLERAESDPEQREHVRELMVRLFGELGHDHPLTVQYRRRLATAIY